MRIQFDDERERARVQRALNDILRSRAGYEMAVRRKRSWSASEKAMALADNQERDEVLKALLAAIRP